MIIVWMLRFSKEDVIVCTREGVSGYGSFKESNQAGREQLNKKNDIQINISFEFDRSHINLR